MLTSLLNNMLKIALPKGNYVRIHSRESQSPIVKVIASLQPPLEAPVAVEDEI